MDDKLRRNELADAANSSQPLEPERRIDWATAREIVEGNEKLLFEVLDAFQIEAPQLMKDMRTGLATRDIELLHRAAHTVKNILHHIGAMESGDLAFDIEMIARKKRLDGISPLLERLEMHMHQVEQEVDTFVRESGRG